MLVERTDIDRRSQSVNDTLEIHEIDRERARRNKEASTTLNRMDFEGRSQRLTNASDSHTSATERVSSSHKLSDTRVNESEENLTLVEHAQVGQIRRGDFSSQEESLTNIAQGHVSETNKVSNSEKLFETRINVQEQNLTRIEQQIVDRRSQSITTDSDVRETSRSRHNICETSVDDQEDNSASMAYLVHESREEQDQEAELSGQLRIRSRKDSRNQLSNSQTELNSRIYDQEKTALSMPSVQEERENQKATLSGEAGSSQVMSSQEGSRLESVGHLDKSSSQFFGDFVEKVRQEMSTSHETEIESEHSSKTIDVVQQNILDASVKGRSSTESKKGPSDEMWDVMTGSPQEVAGTEALIKDSTTEGVVVESTPLVNTETTIVKRSGRSLWSYITEIVRKSLGAHSDSHNSAQKSGTRSSSNESISSDTWYSGQEPDDDENDNAKKERLGTAKEASQNRKHVDQTHDKTRPSKSKSPVKDQEVNQGKSFREGTSQVGANVSISLGSTPKMVP
ncbi:hypothetical protein QJS10_CPB14g00168 [Acorus calamus]|uniref:Uncharacterized protein n=1 Tax=Acorus calamus TaxID=4465 RepID=A0AAV9DGH2_ACOCL|nr:hypothetical protein QJS10_CPB14g00168 [Acorus calamus]